MPRPLTRLAIGAVLAIALAANGAGAGDDGLFGFGRAPSAAEIAAIDIDITADGHGLPLGTGAPDAGAPIYAELCAACHGVELEGIKEAGGAALIGGRGTLASAAPNKTVESYWPYATTLFDYVRRAMPLNAPGSLTNDQVYALSAFILHRAGIIGPEDSMNATNLAQVRMPNRDGFVADARPDMAQGR